jgi:ribose-phosphate pyrophosphokinase
MFYAFGPNTPPELRATFNRYAKRDGLSEVPVSIGTFPGGEPFCEIGHGLSEPELKELNDALQGGKLAFIQSTSDPVSKHSMQTLIAARTFKRYGVSHLITVHPFQAFARQEKNAKNHMESISMDDYAFFLKAAGADEVITIEMHSRASEDMLAKHFGKDNVHFLSMADPFSSHMIGWHDLNNLAVGAPDGADKPDDAGQRRANLVKDELNFGERNNVSLFKAWKHRTGVGQSKTLKFEGDVNGKTCNVVDDMVDSGGTLIGIANILKDAGAKEVNCYLTHAILSGNALERLLTTKREDGNNVIDNLVISDTCPEAKTKLKELAKQYPSIERRVTIIDTSHMIYEATVARLKSKPVKHYTTPR